MITDGDKIDGLADRLFTESLAFAGHLSDKEARFLAVLAACVPGEGVILEIGSYKGKSTIILSKAEAAASGRPTVVAVDPLTSPAPTDPSLHGAASCRDEFFANLDRAGVRDQVEFHEKMSQDLAATWSRPIRLLWIDGDHTFEGVTSDFENYSPHLVHGGVIAFHDVMHCSGVTPVFAQRVLRSDIFGCAGIVGSIGWAQRRIPNAPDSHRDDRQCLASRLDRHAWAADRGNTWFNKTIAKLLRWRVPHGALSARTFREMVDGIGPLTSTTTAPRTAESR